MAWMWPFGTMIRQDERLGRGGRKRDKAKAKAARTARRKSR